MADHSSNHDLNQPASPGKLPPDDSSRSASNPQDLAAQSPPPQPDKNPSPAGPESDVVLAHGPSHRRVDTQQTVISKRPPVGNPSDHHKVSPTEMGMTLQGQQLDHFQLGEFVGGGGMGAVFKATDTKLDRTVAVKILSRGQADEDVLRRFRNEAQSAARLDHPNIARVYYVGEDQGWNYIVFEFIEGANIRDVVERDGPLSLEDAINYTLQVAEALEHASQRDVVHRDIKPSNVLVMSDGRVKVVDMGLARLHQVEAAADDLTASGVTLGTFDYISPEQAYDPRSADVRSDLYSLGCTLYYMLTGRPPFPNGTVIQKLLSHTSEPPPDARLYRPQLPEEVANVLSKLLVKQPEKRYQQPSQLIGELLLLADHLGLQRTAMGGRVWITDKQPSAFVRFVPVLASLVALFVAVFSLDYYLRPSNGEVAVPSPPRLEAPLEAEDDGSSLIPRIDGDASSNRPVDPVAKKTEEPDPPTTPSSPGNKGTDNSTTTIVNTEPKDTSTTPSDIPPNNLARSEPGTLPGESLSPSNIEGEISVGLSDSRAELSVAESNAAELVASATNPSITSSTNSAEPSEIHTLIVGNDDMPAARGAKIFSSLQKAIAALESFPQAKVLELHYNGPREEKSLAIANRQLTLRAGKGYSPEIFFQLLTLESDTHRRMLRLSGGSLVCEDIHFRLELPGEPSASPWALFELDQIESLSLRRCTLTILNNDAGSEPQDRVAFFEVLPRRPADQTANNGESWITPTIELENCIARGKATLVQADGNEMDTAYKVSPFTLSWQQGLLATNRRLVEASGSASKLDGPNDLIDLQLDHVTVVAMKGLGLLENHPEQPHLLPIKVQLDHCILLTDPQSPLFEHKIQEHRNEVEKLLSISGIGSFFPDTSVIWQINALGDAKKFDFNSFAQKWPQVELPRRAVMWSPFTEGKFSTFTKLNYLLIDSDNNLAAKEGAGFTPGLLPEVPEAIQAKRTTPAPDPTPEKDSDD